MAPFREQKAKQERSMNVLQVLVHLDNSKLLLALVAVAYLSNLPMSETFLEFGWLILRRMRLACMRIITCDLCGYSYSYSTAQHRLSV